MKNEVRQKDFGNNYKTGICNSEAIVSASQMSELFQSRVGVLNAYALPTRIAYSSLSSSSNAIKVSEMFDERSISTTVITFVSKELHSFRRCIRPKRVTEDLLITDVAREECEQ